MAGDIRIETGFLSHPKTKMLRRRIGVEAPLILMRLWFWASEHRVEGVFYDMTDEMIEDAADWDGEPGEFVSALIAAKFMDDDAGMRALHDWRDHQPWVCSRDARRTKAKNAAAARWTPKASAPMNGDVALHDATSIATSMPVACSEHARSNAPNPTQPNPTQTQPKTKPEARAPLALPVWLPLDSWGPFVEMRKRIKAPLTDRAIQLTLGQLETLRAQGHDPARVLDQSVMNGWKGLFPVKVHELANRPRPPQAAPKTYLDAGAEDLLATMRNRMEVSNG